MPFLQGEGEDGHSGGGNALFSLLAPLLGSSSGSSAAVSIMISCFTYGLLLVSNVFGPRINDIWKVIQQRPKKSSCILFGNRCKLNVSIFFQK